MFLYVTKNDAKLGYSDGALTIRVAGSGEERTLPFAQIEGISVFGMAQLSTQLIKECISRKITIGYYSEDGHYFGSTGSFARIDPERQKKQILLTDDRGFCLAWSKQIVRAKILNSIAMLSSVSNVYEFSKNDLKALYHSLSCLEGVETIEEVVGFEGNAARCYFGCLSKVVLAGDLSFAGRTAHPPKDPFNAMLSFGYSLLYRNIIGAIEKRGLHPYFAFMHKTKYGHASLASDPMEEFRAPLVDKVAVEIANSGLVEAADFYRNDSGATYMNKETAKRFTDALSSELIEGKKYYASIGDGRKYGFQTVLDMKLSMVIDAIEQADPRLYIPFVWEAAK